MMNLNQIVSTTIVFAVSMSVNAARLGNEVYDLWKDGRDEGMYRFDPTDRNENWYQSYYAFTDKGEIVTWCVDGTAVPVEVSGSQETFTPYIIHGTTGDRDFESIEVWTDADMYKKYYRGEEPGADLKLGYWGDKGGDRQWPVDLDWDKGPRATRKWVVVQGREDSGWRYSKAFSIGIKDATSTQVLNYNGGRSWIWNSDEDNPYNDEYAAFVKVKGGVRPSDALLTVLPKEKPSAEWQKARTLRGTFGAVVPDGEYGVVEIKCGKVNKKGIAKVSATLTYFDGKKIRLKAQSVDVSSSEVSLNWPANGFDLVISGNSFSRGPLTGVFAHPAKVGGELWKSVVFDFGFLSEMKESEVQYPNAPQTISIQGKKWDCGRAAKVKWHREKCGNGMSCGEDFWMVDTSRGSNVSGLKISYNVKTGAFKGSFKAYAWDKKKFTVKISGFVVDGVAHGVAMLKKPSYTWPIVIE